jgi:hypothetical protein
LLSLSPLNSSKEALAWVAVHGTGSRSDSNCHVSVCLLVPNRYGTATGASLTNDGTKLLELHGVPPVLNHVAAACCQGVAYLTRSSLPVAIISPLFGSVAKQ